MPLLSLEKFAEASEKQRKRFDRFLVIGAGLGFGLMLVWVVIREVLETFSSPAFHSAYKNYFAAGIFVLTLLGILGCLWRASKEVQDQPELQCPYCQKPLGTRRQIVIATRNCSHCGRTVLEAPLEKPGDLPGSTHDLGDARRFGPLENFREAAELHGKRADRFLLFGSGLVFGIIVVAFLAIEVAKPFFPEPFHAGFIAAVVFIFALPFLFWGWRRFGQEEQSHPVLNCPHCQKSLLSSQIVIATRNCVHCGQTVFESAAENAEVLPSELFMEGSQWPTTVERFREANEKHTKRVFRHVLSSSGILLGVLLLGVLVKEILERLYPSTFSSGCQYFICMGPILLGVVLFLWRISRAETELKSHPELKCPHCQKFLASYSQIVIATRNCFHCGKPVIETPKENSRDLPN